MRLGWTWWLPGILALTACATGPRVDTRYAAVGQDSRVRFIIIHYTQLDFQHSLQRLTRADVSSHYLVDRDPPTIYRLVPEARRAWHAGPSYWQGATALNASSVGIELVNLGNGDDPEKPYEPFPAAQIDSVIALVRDIQRRHAVRPDRILGHAEVQPQTRTDPGPQFPWRRLADAGLIPWPDEQQVVAAEAHWRTALPSAAWWQQRLAAHGFDVSRSGVLDADTRRVLAVFQMRYRPARYDGEPDPETAALLEVVTSAGGLRIRGSDGAWTVFRPE
jgi:N-acetylmuramoyl-L-alanine amidase